MTVVYTGMEDLDKNIVSETDAKQAFYADYLLEEKEADTVVLSTNIETKIPFKDFLFALRRDNKRVILLIGDEKSPYLGYALALGIYDLVFDPITIDNIINLCNNPARFSDIAHLYLGLRGRVSFEDPTAKPIADGVDIYGDAKTASEQARGLLQYMGKKPEKQNINELLLDMEQIIIQQSI
jgi:hypothetical protein